MMRNMATWDRMLRLIVVIAMAAGWYAGFVSGTLTLVVGVLAAVFLVTGVSGFCPLYRLVGLATARRG